MAHFGKSLAALGMVLVLAGSVQAQGQGRGRGGFGGGGAMLLSNKSVQEELKVSSDQAAKLNTLSESLRSKAQAENAKLQDLSKEDQREKRQALGKSMNEEMNKELKDILKPDQQKRFQQIALQTRGAQAFADPEIQAKLGLTDDQKTKIKGIDDEAGNQRRELFQGFANDREGTMAKMRQLNKETQEKVTAVLTDSQKKTWKDMTGEPFEVKFEPRPGGGN
jgi:hypothetical protein